MRVIAIDWSGAKVGAHRKIWIAEACDGDLVRLESGRSRGEVTAWLIEEAAEGEPLVVGIDFAFSMPRWFLSEQGMATAHELWREAVAGLAETWLAACEPPFWGRPGKKRYVDEEKRLRRTEVRTAGMKTSPKSVFQIGGAGAVGTASLRGMPELLALHEAGFCVWPFDDVVVGRSVVLEIYPRVWAMGVSKTRPEECFGFMTPERFPRLSPARRKEASESEDAFDAAVSALGMDADRAGLAALPRIDDPQLRAEGIIWGPGWREAVGV